MIKIYWPIKESKNLVLIPKINISFDSFEKTRVWQKHGSKTTGAYHVNTKYISGKCKIWKKSRLLGQLFAMQTITSEHAESVCCHWQSIDTSPKMFSTQVINNIRPFFVTTISLAKTMKEILNRNKYTYENWRENDDFLHNVEYLQKQKEGFQISDESPFPPCF